MQLAAKSLLGTLSDVLDFSKVEAGQLSLEHQPFMLDDVLDTVSAVAASNAWAKGVEPVFAVAPEVPRALLGDQVRLGQVLLNLVSNAIKFTDTGEVVLAVRLVACEPGQARLAFSVRDTGIGIAPDQQERMFEAFSQADNSVSRKYGGAGLGLAICRRLVDLMGGQLQVESTLGDGASFSFEARFPLAPEPPALPAPGRGMKVLVADDNAAALAALAEACERFGWQVDRAAGGAKALALLRAGRDYDFAFLDSAMPDLDGASVLAYARSDQSIVLPPCALTAADPDRERLAALSGDLRISAVLGKPFTRRGLDETLAELRGAPLPVQARSTVRLAARLNGMRILLVEDNVINQEVANYALVYAGATVDIAENGRVALAMLAEPEARYDAVLMDLQMPVMNGFEATAEIRALGFAHLPIVAMTANAMEEDRRRALAAGMDAHLAKPIEVDVLVDTLLRVTGSQHRSSPAAPAPALAAPPSIPGIDLKATLPRFGGAFANFAAVFQRFEGSQGQVLAEVRLLLERGDRAGAQQLVHRLRGVAANLGATDVAAQAFDFEQALRGADDAALALRLARLDAALQVVLEASRDIAALAHGAAPGPTAAGSGPQREELAALLDLLQNNNLKAMAQFDAMRPGMKGMLAPAAETALAEAIGTLRFDVAATLLQDILNGNLQA
jgi:CheY-like chemotaxis protein/anti-sigma regulatory factor (Ser/Thr protein kinase)